MGDPQESTAARSPHSTPQAPCLAVSGLAGRYGSRTVFAGVEFSLSPGDCLIVAGSNGSGKSTLLRILSGLVRPHRGSVCLSVPNNAPLTFGPSMGDPSLMGRWVGLAAPDLELYGELSAEENLSFFARLRGIVWDQEKSLKSLAWAGLEGRSGQRLSTFSSGMKQRMRLLFAIQNRPPLLLLDEPGSNLDDAGRAVVARIVEQQLEHGMVVLATNDDAEMRYGEQVLRLS